MKLNRSIIASVVLFSSVFCGSLISAQASDLGSIVNIVEVTYSPVNLNQKFERYTRRIDEDAFALSFTQSRQISYVYPLYLQYGAGLQYTYHINKDQDDVKYNGTYLSAGFKNYSSQITLNLPVNLMYCFSIPDIDVSFMPYAGLNLSWNIAARQKYTEWNSVDGERTTNVEKTNLLKKDDMGGHPYSRVQLGWQVGARVSYGRFLFGVAYQGPFTNLQVYDDYKLKMSQVNISLGFMF